MSNELSIMQSTTHKDFPEHIFEMVNSNDLRNLLNTVRSFVAEMRGNLIHLKISDKWPNETATERRVKIEEIEAKINLYNHYLDRFNHPTKGL